MFAIRGRQADERSAGRARRVLGITAAVAVGAVTLAACGGSSSSSEASSAGGSAAASPAGSAAASGATDSGATCDTLNVLSWETYHDQAWLDEFKAETGITVNVVNVGSADEMFAKVKAALARANELDPLDTELADWGTWALFMSGETQAAREWAETQMRRHPDNGFVHSGAAIAAYLRGEHAESIALAKKGADLTERAPVATAPRLFIGASWFSAGARNERWAPRAPPPAPFPADPHPALQR